ncbi:MAG TPA: c-type cytochrome domain-containing protein [Cyclobacteriaceae bacterium]|nr:c-type cytochrome domain-containing protein [Cyclobacteriaceae bacterium]
MKIKLPGLKQVFDHSILALSVLLVFLLVFERYIRFPGLIGYLGHFHPVILHFPIVLILAAILNSWTKVKVYQEFLLPLATIAALVTAITGFILSFEKDARGDLLLWHQWLGAGMAIASSLWYGLEYGSWKSKYLVAFIKILMLPGIIVAGHFGGMVTHGRDFLTPDFAKSEPMVEIPDDPEIFTHAILPVLKDKCITCHNPDKSRGGLVMADYASFLKGGETGSAFIPGDPENSELIRRIQLPFDSEDHMPPEDRTQLSSAEIQLLEHWIRAGASDTLRLSDLKTDDPFRPIVMNFLPMARVDRTKNLPEVDEATIQKLSTDYCTITRQAAGMHALSVNMFPHPGYEPRELTGLQSISKNIVNLDLSNMPIGKSEITFIKTCEALEWLELDNTSVSDEDLVELKDLPNLTIIKAYGTKLTDKSAGIFQSMPSLSKLFIWNTAIPGEALEKLRSSRPGLQISTGPSENIQFTSILPAPKLDPGRNFFIDPFYLKFVHPLNDIGIFYTMDGSIPGPGGTMSRDSLIIDHAMVLKFMAAKPGWESSQVDSVNFFRTSVAPDSCRLRYPPDRKYSGSGITTLFDLRKGSYNIYTDSLWLGFQGKNMELIGEWNEPVTLRSITLSSLVNTLIHLFPPESIEIRGGMSESSAKVIGTLNFSSLKMHQGNQFRYYTCRVNPVPMKFISIRVRPVEKLPAWHDAKGSPGWFFVDELIFEPVH